MNNSLSSSLHALINWGKKHLLSKNEPEALLEFYNQWKQENVPSQELDFHILEKRIEVSLNWLHGSETLDLDVNDPIQFDRIQKTLESFDQLVYLVEAMEHFPDSEIFNETIHKRAEELMNRIIIDHEPSYLRLIPLNQWRLQILKKIPSDLHFLFPWYNHWSHLPDDLYLNLVEIDENRFKKRFQALLPEDEDLDLFLAELVADKDLLKSISRDEILFRSIPKAIENSEMLQLFSISQEEVKKRYYHDPIRKNGVITSALSFIESPVDSESQWIEKIFLTAFCFPALEKRDRLDLFSEIEAFLKKSDTWWISNSEVLKKLNLWAKGDIRDEKLGKNIFNMWEERIKDSTSIAVDYPAIQYSIDKLKEQKRIETKFTEKGKSPSLLPPLIYSLRIILHHISPKFIATASLICLVISISYNLYILKNQAKPSFLEMENKSDMKQYPYLKKDINIESESKKISEKQKVKPPPQKIKTEDRINLLIPIIENKIDQGKPTTSKIEKHVPNIPMNRFNLSQLILVAILLTRSGNKAVIEDITGQGYIIEEGSFIGQYNGRVSKILKEKVIIEQEIKGPFGNITKIQKELLLQKMK